MLLLSTTFHLFHFQHSQAFIFCYNFLTLIILTLFAVFIQLTLLTLLLVGSNLPKFSSFSPSKMVALTDRIERQSSVDVSESCSRMFKVLMLHGYTQSGPLFKTKTRAIEKILNKQFSSGKLDPTSCFYGYTGVQLIYPTGPVRLCPHNVLGYHSKPVDNDEESELWAWWTWTRDADLGASVGVDDMNTGTFTGLDRTLSSIARVIRAHGGIDAIMGFSQGAAAALLVTSLLEPGREQAFREMQKQNKDALPFPEEWRDISSLCPNGLKFTVSYSGFRATSQSYRAFYEPAIQTPVLHFIGKLDNVIDGFRTLALVKSCTSEDTTLIYHPGVHYVPNRRFMESALLSFITRCLKRRSVPNSLKELEAFF